MVAAASIAKLADELTDVQLRQNPFDASFMAVGGYDDAVPDLSPASQQAWRERLVDIVVRCDQLDADATGTDSRVLLEAIRDQAGRALAGADSRVDEFSVTTFPVGGPSVMLLIAAHTAIHDPASASAYLARCRRLATYLDQYTAQVHAAARCGLRPVAPLVHDAIRQLRDHVGHPDRDPMLAHRPPAGWAGATTWRDDVERVVADEIRPAIGRHIDLLTELLPTARPQEKAGLIHVPGGVAAYACCIRNGTTLALDPGEIHRLGLTALAEIEDRVAELGSQVLGTRDAAEVMARLRAHTTQAATEDDPMARAVSTVARVQDRLAEVFRPPLPPPCSIEPMPPHMADFGAPPMYMPPARDGSRSGVYLFNRTDPGQAGSWALEATAFHEAVPGHHAQYARLKLIPDLPLLLTAMPVIPHSEGWGLYAEQLADEFGFYSDDLQRLGMLSCAAWRAVRLVVDSGLHGLGWSRSRAREFALAHSPMPQAVVHAEIDRYISVPGQALGYLIGQREILRLREHARAQLGAAFDIRDFHSAVLDHGSLPLRVLAEVVEGWVTSAAAA
jgi:uncharacterized protein (DUF885 family)